MGNEQGNKGQHEKPITSNELQTYIIIVKAKLTQQRNKKVFEIGKKRKELLGYLKDNNPEMAKLKMDGIIQEENYITAFDILGTIMEILKEKCTYLLQSVKCPNDMRASLDTVIFASTRVEIQEFSNIRDLITKKYGLAYVSNANSNVDKLVNKQIVDKLTFTPNPEPFLISRIKQICKEESFDYTFPQEVIPIDFNVVNSVGIQEGQQLNFGVTPEQSKTINNKDQALPTHSFIEHIGNPNQGNKGQQMEWSQDSQYQDPNQMYNQSYGQNNNQQSNFQNQGYQNQSNNYQNPSNYQNQQPQNNYNQQNVDYNQNSRQNNFQNMNADFGEGPKYNMNQNNVQQSKNLQENKNVQQSNNIQQSNYNIQSQYNPSPNLGNQSQYNPSVNQGNQGSQSQYNPNINQGNQGSQFNQGNYQPQETNYNPNFQEFNQNVQPNVSVKQSVNVNSVQNTNQNNQTSEFNTPHMSNQVNNQNYVNTSIKSENVHGTMNQDFNNYGGEQQNPNLGNVPKSQLFQNDQISNSNFVSNTNNNEVNPQASFLPFNQSNYNQGETTNNQNQFSIIYPNQSQGGGQGSVTDNMFPSSNQQTNNNNVDDFGFPEARK